MGKMVPTKPLVATGRVYFLVACAHTRTHIIIKSCIFDQPDLFGPKLTRHFLQYARRAHARISSSWHEPACMDRHA